MKTKSSANWNYFSEFDSNTAKCNVCKKKYSRKGGTTSSLKSHLKLLHFDKYEALLKDEKEHKLIVKNGAKTPAEEDRKQISLPDILQKKQKWDASNSKSKNIDKLISEMIVLEDLPFSFVESVGFCRLMQNIAPHCNLRGRKFFTNNICDELYPQVAKKIAESLKKFIKLSFTTDIWSEPSANVSLISLTVHGITDDFEQVKVILKCQPLNERHTGDLICEEIKEMLHECDIEYEKIHCFIRDGGSNMVRAMQLSKIPDVSCTVHQLQLCIRSALGKSKDMTQLITKCKNIVTHFSHSLIAQTQLKKIQVEQLSQQPSGVIQDCNTRWNSTFYLIERLIKIKDSICLYASKQNIPQISPEEWLHLDKLLTILQPFEEITRNMSESKVSISSVIPLIHVLKQNLQIQMEETKQNGTCNLQAIIGSLIKDINNRFGKLQSNNLFALATYLDPRYKLKFFNEVVKERVESQLLYWLDSFNSTDTADECDSPVIKKSRMELTINKGDHSTCSMSPNLRNISVSNRPSLASILMYSDEDENTSANESTVANKQILWKALINEYNNEKRIKWTEDPLVWWRLNTKFQVFKPVVRQFLSPPPGSIPSEQLFSGASLIYSPLRNRLEGEKAAKLLFIKYNLPILKFNY